jgi:hypothetical protein
MIFYIALLVFASIWAPVLSSRYSGIDTQALLLIGACVWGACVNRAPMPAPIRYALLALVAFLAYVIITYSIQVVLSGTAISPFAIMRPIRSIVTMYGCYCIALILSRSGFARFGMIELVFISIVMHGSIVIAQSLSPDFQDWVYAITNAGELAEDRPWFKDYRFAGLAGAGGSMTSMFHGFGVLLIPLIFSRRKFSIPIATIASLSACILLVAIVFTGRLGLFIVALGFIMMIGLPKLMPALSDANIRARAIGWAVGYVAFSAVTYIIMVIAFGELSMVERAISRTEDGFNYEESGIDVLFSDFLVLPDWKNLLIGDQQALTNTGFDRTFNTDIGYLVLLNGYGMLGSALIYSFYFIVMFFSTTPNKRIEQTQHQASASSGSNATALQVASFIFALLILFANYKEPCALARIGLSISALLFSSWAIHHYRINVHSRQRVEAIR